MERNNNTLMIVFIAGIVLISVILVLNQGETKIVNVGQDQQNTISVSGNAKLEVEPDQVEVYVNIETSALSAEEAKNENSRISDNVMEALKKEGVKDDEIETTSFRISPRYTYDRNKGESILQGYTASNVLKITTKEIDDAGNIIDTAVESGANNIQSVNFGLSKERQKEVSGEALVRAAEVARDKAESLANSLGVNLGKIVAIQESNFDFVPFVAVRADFAVAESQADTEIVPGKVDVSARVTVAYEIR